MRAADGGPIVDDELESLFSIFPEHGRIVLAVSGGADSTALMLLASRWRAGRSKAPELVTATVNHGLRPQSRKEASRVAAFAKKCCVPHEVLVWKGAKPTTGIEAAARAARYRLLSAFAQRSDARYLATAHTLDDQAETVLMRLAAGSGPAGLAAMRPSERRDDLTVARPFLGVRKQRLVATLQRDGVIWSEDPMNRDGKFARPRLRAAAAALAREGLTPERLARLAMRMARWDDAVSASAEWAREAFRRSDGPPGFDGWAFVGAPEELVLRVLTAEIREVGGEIHGLHAPRLERLEALWEELRLAVLAGRPARRTLGGAVISVDGEGAVLIARAAPRRTRRPAGA